MCVSLKEKLWTSKHIKRNKNESERDKRKNEIGERKKIKDKKEEKKIGCVA